MLRILFRPRNHWFLCKSYINNIIKSNIFTTRSVLEYKQNLPRLPVPKLDNTLKLFLESVRPILTDQEFETTKKLVGELGKSGGVGEKLQKLLMDRATKVDNWLTDWWTNVGYLQFRDSVCINVSPGLVFPVQKFKNDDDVINYAAKLALHALLMKRNIDNSSLPIDKAGKDELDMGSYNRMFGVCRIPVKGQDEIKLHPDSCHFVVACNNNYFKVTGMDSKKNVVPYPKIIETLKKIMSQATTTGPAIGILSGNNRDTWTDHYNVLLKDSQNKKSVQEIQKALFLLCLDRPMLAKTENWHTLAGSQAMHGGGSKSNSANRWFDKTVEFFIGKEGCSGICMEHSPVDGQPFTSMADYILNHLGKTDSGPEAQVPDFEPLKFNVNSELQKCIDASTKFMDEAVDNVDLHCDQFTSFGKGFTKSQKFSPDAFLQMMFQLAYYKTHGKPAVQYEAAATAKFKRGRTETIRVQSTESVKFCKIMLTDAPPAEKRKALEAAIKRHSKYTIAAVNGLGVDRHLFGLKKIAQDNGIPIPKLYEDVGWTRSTTFTISTSQVPTKHAGFMCFGPVVPDGYGFCYNPRAKDILYGVSSFKKSPNSNTEKYHNNFKASLMEIHDILEKAPKA